MNATQNSPLPRFVTALRIAAAVVVMAAGIVCGASFSALHALFPASKSTTAAHPSDAVTVARGVAPAETR